MQRLAEEVWRIDPMAAQETPGELASMTRQHVGHEGEWTRQVWFEGDECLAWGWIKPPARLFWEVHPNRPELLFAVFHWFLAQADERPLEVGVRNTNQLGIEALERLGLRHDRDAPWIRWNARLLDEVDDPVVPDGYRLTTMAEIPDVAARAAVHRDAFNPSRVTDESYERVMAEWPYRPELDCVVVAPDGSFASFALGWIDETNRLGILEPVGTRSAHRLKGLARASCLHALQQLRAAGAERAHVGSRGDDAYPVPRLVYESIGFREFNRSLPYVKA